MPDPQSPVASELSSEAEGGESSDDEEGYPGEGGGPPPPKRTRPLPLLVEEFCCTYNNMRWKLRNGRAVLEFKDVSLNTSYVYS